MPDGLLENLEFKDETDLDFEQRLGNFELQKEKNMEEAFKRLNEELPKEQRILLLEEAKAKEQAAKRLSDLEAEYGEIIDTPPLKISLTELLNKEFPPIEWLTEKIIPEQSLVALSGLPGSYKSWITQHLALCVATGTPLFGKFQCKEGKVLIIDKENQLSLIKQRFNLLGALEGLEIYLFNKEFFIEDEAVVNQICEMIVKEKISLIIIDSLIRIYQKKDENSANDMAEVFRQIKKFQDNGAPVVFTHHHRKQSIIGKNVAAESMRGSSDILASVDCHLAVDKVEDGIKITQTKLRQEMAIPPFKIKLEGDENHLDFSFLGEIEEAKEKVVEAKTDILQALEEGEQSRTDIIERFKGSYGSKTVDEALKSFDPEEVIYRTAERGKKYYRLAGSELEGGLFNPASQNGNTYI